MTGPRGPALPCLAERIHHLATVDSNRLIWAATWAWGILPLIRWTINKRSAGVKRALACDIEPRQALLVVATWVIVDGLG